MRKASSAAGGILSPDILERLDDLPGQKASDFGLDSSAKVKDEIARAWADAQDYWRIFQRKLATTPLEPRDSSDTIETARGREVRAGVGIESRTPVAR